MPQISQPQTRSKRAKLVLDATSSIIDLTTTETGVVETIEEIEHRNLNNAIKSVFS